MRRSSFTLRLCQNVKEAKRIDMKSLRVIEDGHSAGRSPVSSTASATPEGRNQQTSQRAASQQRDQYDVNKVFKDGVETTILLKIL
jgi:hypothetical protein